MKTIYILLLTLTSLAGFCQVNEVDPDALPERFKVYYHAPIPFGNNVLAKAHTNNFNGIGFSLTMFRIKQVHVTIALEHSSFSVSDISMVGNIETTYVTNFLIEGMYKLPITDKMSINPEIGIGIPQISQSGYDQYYGSQYGVSYNIGGEFDYKIIGRLRAFAGLGYTYMRLRTNTAHELESFYSNMHMLNLSVGLKI